MTTKSPGELAVVQAVVYGIMNPTYPALDKLAEVGLYAIADPGNDHPIVSGGLLLSFDARYTPTVESIQVVPTVRVVTDDYHELCLAPVCPVYGLDEHVRQVNTLTQRWNDRSPLFAQGGPLVIVEKTEAAGGYIKASQYSTIVDSILWECHDCIKILQRGLYTYETHVFYKTLLDRLSALIGSREKHVSEGDKLTDEISEAGNGTLGESQPTAASQEGQD